MHEWIRPGAAITDQAQYVDGWGTEETLYSLATDKVYGFSGNTVIFPEYDDPEEYCLAEDDLLNSFQMILISLLTQHWSTKTVLINIAYKSNYTPNPKGTAATIDLTA